jgi:hypothetical protein
MVSRTNGTSAPNRHEAGREASDGLHRGAGEGVLEARVVSCVPGSRVLESGTGGWRGDKGVKHGTEGPKKTSIKQCRHGNVYILQKGHNEYAKLRKS